MGTRWVHDYTYYIVVELHSTVLTVLVLNLRPNGYALGSYTVIELQNQGLVITACLKCAGGAEAGCLAAVTTTGSGSEERVVC